MLCEELADFSSYYETYKVYLLTFVHRQIDRQAEHKIILNKLRSDLHFPTVEDLMASYSALELSYLRANIFKSIQTDNDEFISQVTKEEPANMLELVDNLSFLLDKSMKRAQMSLCLTQTCSIINYVIALLQDEILPAFKTRTLMFSGLYSQQKGSGAVKPIDKIAKLFEIQEPSKLIISEDSKS